MLSNKNTVLDVTNISKSFKDYASEWHRIASWFGLDFKPKEEHRILKPLREANHKNRGS